MGLADWRDYPAKRKGELREQLTLNALLAVMN